MQNRWSFVCILSLIFLLCSCSSTKKVSRSASGSSYERYYSKSESKLIAEAQTWLGTPYKYAGAEKGCGTDCSGMVWQVYRSTLGFQLPRSSAKMAEFCIKIKDEEVVPGDLVFFATGKDPDRVSHVGIMMDKLNFIHASSSKGVVVSTLNNPYYQRTFIMYGRVPPATSSR